MNRTRKSPQSRASGFTLVELLVGLALGIFLVGGVVFMYVSARSASLEAERWSRFQENIRIAGDHLVRDARNAGLRDGLGLTIGEFDAIGQAFAEVGGPDDSRLTIRYSGLASCAEAFPADPAATPPGLVENTWFVADGALNCTGNLRDSAETRTVSLAGGVRSARFRIRCPDATPDCECRLWPHGHGLEQEADALMAACTGVEMVLQLDAPGGEAPITATLNAGFMNVLLGRMAWSSMPD